MITDPHLKGGGQVRYVSNLVSQLVVGGHDVTIGCRRGSVLVERAASAGCAVEDAFAYRSGLRVRAWTSDLARAASWLREHRPDIVHVNGSQDHWVWALANRSLGRPVCVVRSRHNTYPVKGGYFNRLLNRDWTDYQIVVCDVVRQTLAHQPTFDGARMCTIHNGVDAELFKPNAHMRREARAKFGYDDTHVVAGIAARLVEAKGHVFLFRAVAALRGECPQLRVLVLGEGAKDVELRELAQSLGIADLVAFAGFREDMARCVQAFDIGVQPSIDCDTSSFSLKEQMAAEVPVIASDYGGLVEIVTDGVEGLVVPTATVEPLAEAIRAMVRDGEMRRRMGRAGRQRVLRDFTVQVFASKTLDAYREALRVHSSCFGKAAFRP